MKRLKCDKRSLEYEPRPDVQERLLGRHAAWLRVELDLAKDFAAILESKHYYDEDCAGLVEYARKFHYDGRRAMNLARLGQALLLEPELEDEIVSGRIPIEGGFVLSDALRHPKIRDRANWLELARTMSPGGLRAHYRRLREEVARGTVDLRLLTLLITELDRDNFRRLQYLVQALEGREMTEGEVHAWAVNFSLDHKDPVRKARRMLEKRGAKRAVRMEDPKVREARLEEIRKGLLEEERKRNRHIPSELVYPLLDRSDGRCEVPGCARRGRVEMMHLLIGYGDGGDHHLRNLGIGCPRHHRLVDTGRLKCVGFTEGEQPIFEDSKGRLLIPDARPPPPKEKPEA